MTVSPTNDFCRQEISAGYDQTVDVHADLVLSYLHMPKRLSSLNRRPYMQFGEDLFL